MSDPVTRLNAALEGRYAIECPSLVGIGMAALIVGLQFLPSTASAQTPPREAVDPLNTPIWIEGGTFSMGSDDGDTLEQPVHQVTVSGFWIQQHEVTNEEYRRFVPEQRFPNGEERHPVYASWHEAMNYAESRGGTLPTEAQWEFAARGTEGRTYAWGDEDPTCERAQIGGCGGQTIPVMSLPDGATPEGVHDLTGNVWEWVRDWVGDYGAAAETDPTGPATGEFRVLRGGSFSLAPRYLGATYRNTDLPWFRSVFQGFRVAWPAADPSLDDQLGIFAAVVQGVMNEERWETSEIMVDPRPMTLYHRMVFPDSTHYVSVDPSLISARASVIRDLGATTASALPKRPNCSPILILPSDRVTSGCPSQPEVVWVVEPEAEPGKDDARGDEAGKDEWTLRMFAFFYGPGASLASSFDAIVIRNESGWVLDRLIRHVLWE